MAFYYFQAGLLSFEAFFLFSKQSSKLFVIFKASLYFFKAFIFKIFIILNAGPFIDFQAGFYYFSIQSNSRPFIIQHSGLYYYFKFNAFYFEVFIFRAFRPFIIKFQSTFNAFIFEQAFSFSSVLGFYFSKQASYSSTAYFSKQCFSKLYFKQAFYYFQTRPLFPTNCTQMHFISEQAFSFSSRLLIFKSGFLFFKAIQGFLFSRKQAY